MLRNNEITSVNNRFSILVCYFHKLIKSKALTDCLYYVVQRQNQNMRANHICKRIKISILKFIQRDSIFITTITKIMKKKHILLHVLRFYQCTMPSSKIEILLSLLCFAITQAQVVVDNGVNANVVSSSKLCVPCEVFFFS